MNEEKAKRSKILSELNEIICSNRPEDEILLGIRSYIVDIELTEQWDKLSEEELTFLYMLKKLANDIWENIGTDSPYDVAKIKTQFKDISKDVVEFAKQACNKNAKIGNKEFKYFASSVNKFYSLIYHLDEGLLDNKT